MNKAMSITGFIFLALGLISSLVVFFNIDHKALETATEVAESLVTNPVANAELAQTLVVNSAQKQLAATLLFMGVGIGFVLIALSKIVTVLENKFGTE